MNRITTTAVAAVIGGFALLALTACKSDLSGTPAAAQATSPAGSASGGALATSALATSGLVATSDLATSGLAASGAASSGASAGKGSAATSSPTGDPSITTSSSNSAAGGGSGGGASGGSGGGSGSGGQAGSTAPAITSAHVSCDFNDSDQTYHENLTYAVANATGMALSVDNPGIVGSFGSYGPQGTIELPDLGCYTGNGEQTYTLYTVGGSGPQASKTIRKTGTHSRKAPVTTTAPAPAITSASVSCDFNDGDQTYHETLTYQVANATGMALSIDNPGAVGSFGTYGASGSLEIPNLGCYSENGQQTYTLYSVGGTGDQASKTITRTGTHTHSAPVTTTTTPTSTN